MIDISAIDHSELDRPDVLAFLFHPRPEFGESGKADNIRDLLIPVDDSVHIGARLHGAGKSRPVILFFHGNGETVSDYDDLGPLFNRLGVGFFPVDYRGYGRSTGVPTITNMMRDCHRIFDFALSWLKTEGYTGSLIVMGRSLGSASALELAAHYEKDMAGLVIESGFADMEGLYERLGISGTIPEGKKKGLSNVGKIAGFKNPTLVIHAEFDHIIPFSDGRKLHEAAGAAEKMFLMIPGANHNDIFYRGMDAYLEAVTALTDKITAAGY